MTRRSFMSAAAGVLASLCLPLKAIKAAVTSRQQFRFVSPNSVFTKTVVRDGLYVEFPTGVCNRVYIGRCVSDTVNSVRDINRVLVPIQLYEACDKDSIKAATKYQFKVNVACATLLLASAKHSNNIISYADMCKRAKQNGKLKFTKCLGYIVAVDNTRDSLVMPIRDYMSMQKYRDTFYYWSWLGMVVLDDKSVWAAKLP